MSGKVRYSINPDVEFPGEVEHLVFFSDDFQLIVQSHLGMFVK